MHHTVNFRIYAYLRASTSDQDASRADSVLESFCTERGLEISHSFIENESGATLKRPELFRLLEIAQPGDVLLVEHIDRLSRLNKDDWEKLKTTIKEKQIKVVSKDLPTSHHQLETDLKDEFTKRMLDAVNSMMLDMLAAISRKDFDDRRDRQKQGVQKAKELGKYKGRPVDEKLHANIRQLLQQKNTWSQIESMLGCSRHTINKVSKQLKKGLLPA